MNLDLTNLSSSQTKQLNQIAERNKDSFTNFIDDICRKYGDDPLFWAAPLISRKIVSDDTFLVLCRVELAVEIARDNRPEIIMAATEAEALAVRNALKTAGINGVKVDATSKESASDKVKASLLRIKSYQDFVKKELSYIDYSRDYKCDLSEPFSLVVTPLLSASFDGLKYNDRYFTGITEYKKLRFLPTLNNNKGISDKDFLDTVYKCENYDFIPGSLYFNKNDLQDIKKYWKCIDRVKKDTFTYNGYDVTAVIRHSLERGKTATPSYKGILLRRIFANMKAAGAKIDNVLIWYEGRSSDIMTASAVKEFFPEANCVGYEAFPLNENDLAQFASQYQYESGHAPDSMAITMELHEAAEHRFCKDIGISIVPPLRAEYVLRNVSEEAREQKTIFVVLPYFTEVAKKLIIGVDSYMRKSDANHKVMIKNHPVYDAYTLKDYGVNDVCFEPEYVHGPMNKCYDGKDVVVTASTSASLEILFAKLPLIILCPNGELEYTGLPAKGLNHLFASVYGDEEMGKALDEFLGGTTVDYSVLEHLLASKNEETIGRMFK